MVSKGKWCALSSSKRLQAGGLASKTLLPARLSIPVGPLDTSRSPSNLPSLIECQSYMRKAIFLLLQLRCQVWCFSTSQTRAVPANPSGFRRTTDREGRARYQAGQRMCVFYPVLSHNMPLSIIIIGSRLLTFKPSSSETIHPPLCPVHRPRSKAEPSSGQHCSIGTRRFRARPW